MKRKVIKKIRSREIASLLQKLVRIPTINPPGNEAECARIVAEKLKALNFEVNLYEAEKGRTNVVGVLKGSGGGKNFLLYSGHLDVVSPGQLGDWRFDPFEGKIENGKIHGRGTADHKGTIAASIYSIQSIIESGVSLKGDLIFLAVADEEMGSRNGAGFLVQKKYVYGDAGLAAVPHGKEEIGVASMGFLRPKITVIGKQAHGARPREGINAIDKAADLIKALHGMKFKKKARIIPSKGSTGFLSVTKISSGIQTNIIPGKAELVIDRRLVPGETPEEALSQIKDVIRSLESKDKTFHATIEVLDSDMGASISKSESIVKILGRNIQDILGITPKAVGFTGIGDVRHFINGAKIPMISWCPGGFGPNAEYLMHVPNEYIYLSELLDFAKVLAATIMDVCEYES